MSNKTVKIENVEHEVSEEVFDLIHKTSLERDRCRVTLMEIGDGKYSKERLIELISKGCHFEDEIERES